MPIRPGSACTQTPGCKGVVRGGRCSVCGPKPQAAYDRRRGSAAERGYDRRWQRLRLMHLRAHPLCVECLKHGLVTQAAEVDHIRPKRDGGDDSDTNLQSLCKPCHSRKTMREKMRKSKIGETTVPVTVVTGPPGSGKTTFVTKHAQWGDLVVDVDALYSALSGQPWYEKPAALLPFVLEARDAVLDRLHAQSDLRHAWIITSEADHAELQRLKARYSAKLFVLEVDAAECYRRIAADPRRSANAAQWQPLIQRWWDTYTNTRP